MRALVTGSAGHLGEALIRVLRARGDEVAGIDILESPYTDVVGTIADAECVRTAMRGADVVFHAATLHKPHVGTHSKHEFVATNVAGTLTLLEEAVRTRARAFVFTSSTSAFGDALRPPPGSPAAWITEQVGVVPRNIYGVTKTAAEDLCELFSRKHGLACVVLRTSRFFLDEDDDAATRRDYEDLNVKINELLYRRVDLEDVVDAHVLSAQRAQDLGFAKLIVSATTPFQPADVTELRRDTAAVVARYVPQYREVYAERAWRLTPSLDRVYSNAEARRLLGWRPRRDFAHAIDCLRRGADPVSELARAVGVKLYHAQRFPGGMYPVE
jgi:nucleoside-diphosphate-sugar epimerase